MNIFTLSIIVVGTVVAVQTNSLHANEAFEAKTFEGEQKAVLNYRIHTPNKLDKNKKYPIILMLHGSGERGNDDKAQLKTNSGPNEILAYAKKNNTEVIIIAPQVPKNEKWVDVPWNGLSHDMPKKPSAFMKMATDLLKNFIKNMPVDKQRIYVTGLSMGGFGTWDVIQRNPELFAAAIPICGGGDTKLAEEIRNVPIWVFHGGNDTVVKTSRSRDMVAALKKAGRTPLCTEYEGVGHNSWSKTYKNDKILKWLFDKKKEK